MPTEPITVHATPEEAVSTLIYSANVLTVVCRVDKRDFATAWANAHDDNNNDDRVIGMDLKRSWRPDPDDGANPVKDNKAGAAKIIPVDIAYDSCGPDLIRVIGFAYDEIELERPLTIIDPTTGRYAPAPPLPKGTEMVLFLDTLADQGYIYSFTYPHGPTIRMAVPEESIFSDDPNQERSCPEICRPVIDEADMIGKQAFEPDEEPEDPATDGDDRDD